MAEWSNALAWKAGKGATPSRVRIPFSPPKTIWNILNQNILAMQIQMIPGIVN